ncbi:hypothetical protein ACTXT7_001808 [Hymenolepis weldensis]
MSSDFGLHREQLVENLKRKPPVSQEEETVDDASCWCPNLVYYLKNPLSQYAVLISKPKTGRMETHVDKSYLTPPRNPEIPEAQRNNRLDRCFLLTLPVVLDKNE